MIIIFTAKLNKYELNKVEIFTSKNGMHNNTFLMALDKIAIQIFRRKCFN